MLIGAGSGALVTLFMGAATPALAMASIMAASAAGALGVFVVLLGRPRAASADMLVEQFQALASEVLVHPVHELVGR